MKHKEILKRSWHILWRYKALWLFGFILAITTISGSSSNAANGASDPNNSQPPPEFLGDSFYEGLEEIEEGFELFFDKGIRTDIVNTVFAIAIGVGCIIFMLFIVGMIFRYMSETALIRMVDRYEENGEKLSIRQGFRLGFSRTAARIFLVDLVINLPLFLLLIFLFIMFLAPMLLLLTASEAAGILGVVLTIGLFFIGIFLAISVGVVLSLLKHFFRRAVAIDNLGIFEAIGYGFQLVRQNLIAIGLMGLITLGINIGLSILLIPIGLMALIMAGIFSGLIGLAAGGLMSLISAGALPVVVGLAVGLPIFIILMVIPLGIIDGWREVYMSTTWTLTYREVRALERFELEELNLEFEGDEPLPELGAPFGE